MERVHYTIQDTPGFGDDTDIARSIELIIKYIDGCNQVLVLPFPPPLPPSLPPSTSVFKPLPRGRGGPPPHLPPRENDRRRRAGGCMPLFPGCAST
ncbi:hypothetical protein Naga_102867g1 [Nannochloropsis gaditana]|uniref:Uncharacterized protein n=1 Tax=Nannochloropsis gaditana TaxID=72520 RepID=W7T8S2_9STRA|nr:hypothetical protein Naga_102867g1 [Nannochloropsis gaditana]